MANSYIISDAAASVKSVGTIIFSKDRAMQLEACLSSLLNTCSDSWALDISVIYKATDDHMESQYNLLRLKYATIEFVKETSFYNDLVHSLKPFQHILFIVDDCVFRKAWSVVNIIQLLAEHTDALGFSLRLGLNTTFCFSLEREQDIPEYEEICISNGSRILSIDWTSADADWGYPLEVSSSFFRSDDILRFINNVQGILNPNTLESYLSKNAYVFADTRPRLLCYSESAAFCIPFNLVQDRYFNRSVLNPTRSAVVLAWLFENGYRFDTSNLIRFVPNACHEDYDLPLKMLNASGAIDGGKKQDKGDDSDLPVRAEHFTEEEICALRLFNLTGQIGVNDERISAILNLADYYIERQSTELARSIASFQAILREKESQERAVGEYLQGKEARCWELTEEISNLRASKDEELTSKNCEIEAKNCEIEAKNFELINQIAKCEQLHADLTAIRSSNSWRFVLLIQGIVIRTTQFTVRLKKSLQFFQRLF